MADDPLEQMMRALSESVASDYNDTIYRLVSSLQFAGVAEEEVEAVMLKVPSIAGDYMGDETKENMALMDLVFLGLLVHEFRDKFIEERTESGEGRSQQGEEEEQSGEGTGAER